MDINIKFKNVKKLEKKNEIIDNQFYNYYINNHHNYTYNDTKTLYLYIFGEYNSYLGKELYLYDKNIKYKPITYYYYRGLEIIQKFLLDKKIKSICEIGVAPTIIEYYNYHNYDINYTIISPFEKHNKLFIDKMINVYKKIELHNTVIDYDFVNSNILNFKKYDLINYSYQTIGGILYGKLNYNFNKGYENQINLLIGFIFTLKNLNYNGCFTLNFIDITTKFQADLYLIIKKYFKTANLYYPEVVNRLKDTGTIGIFTGFKGCSENELTELIDVLNKIKKQIPSIYDLKKTNKVPVQLLDIPISSKDYDEIRDFNTERYFKQFLFLKKIINLKKKPIKKLSKLPTQEQINASLMYLRKWNIPHFPINAEKYLKDTLLTEIYNYIYPINYNFNLPSKSDILALYDEKKIITDNKYLKKNLNKQTLKKTINRHNTRKTLKKKNIKKRDYTSFLNINDELVDDNHLLYASNLFIKSRERAETSNNNKYNYNTIAKNLNYFNPNNKPSLTLHSFINKTYKSIKERVNIEYLKYWEVLNISNLIKDLPNNINSLHLCDNKSMYSNATKRFINIWNREHSSKNEKNILYNEKHVQSAKKQNQNVKSYSFVNHIKYLGDINEFDLITSGCGGDLHTVICSLMASLLLLKKGGSCIVKILFPINNQIITNFIYICYQYFKDGIQFIKPSINYSNVETFMVCRGFIGLPTEITDVFEYIYEDFNNDIAVYDDIYPEPFALQIKEINLMIVKQITEVIDKQLFLSDNYEKIDDRIIKTLYKSIKDKNKEWVITNNLI